MFSSTQTMKAMTLRLGIKMMEMEMILMIMKNIIKAGLSTIRPLIPILKFKVLPMIQKRQQK
jgi:hypothetical protein